MSKLHLTQVTLPASSRPLRRRPVRGLDVDVLVVRFPMNAFTRHRHSRQLQLMVIPAFSAGWMEWRDESKTLHREPIKGSQVWLVPSGLSHAAEITRPTEVINLFVDQDRVDPFLFAAIDGARVFPLANFVGKRGIIHELCQSLCRHAKSPNGPSDWAVAAAGSTLAVELLDLLSQKVGETILPEQRIVEQAIDRINTHLDKGSSGAVPLGAIARDIKVTSRQLRQAFQKLLFTTPRKWSNARRAHLAHARLIAGEPVKTVVDEMGFNDTSHLDYALRKEFGLSAAQIRRSVRKSS